jgi:hypothetical protein
MENMIECKLFNLDTFTYEDLSFFIPEPLKARFLLVSGGGASPKKIAVANLVSSACGVGCQWKFANSEHVVQTSSMAEQETKNKSLGEPPEGHSFLGAIGEHDQAPMTQLQLQEQFSFLYAHLLDGGRVVAYVNGASGAGRFKELFRLSGITSFSWAQLWELIQWVGYRIINIDEVKVRDADELRQGVRIEDHVAEGLPYFLMNAQAISQTAKE